MAAAGAVLNQHFSFAEITWKIKNISHAICPLKMAVNSEDFQVSGRTDTMWRLALSISHEKNAITVYLKMSGPDNYICSVDEKFRVNWMAKLLDSNGEGSLTSERRFKFRVRDSIAVENFTLSEILRNLPHFGPDDLTLKCYMLIDHGEKVDIPGYVPSGLVDLSNAFARLPTEGLFPDIHVKVGTKTFYLHKDMFGNARNISNLIDQQNSYMITLLNYDESSTENLFRYIYSGNLNYVLAMPTIRTSEDIERLDIPELENAYPKEKIELVTVVESRAFDFSWKIENFESLEDSLNGPELNEDGMNSRWQVRLHPKGKINGNEQEKNFVFVEAILLESEEELIDVNMDFNSLDEKGEIYYSRREHKRMSVGDKLELPFFRRGGLLMRKCLIDDKHISLRITLRIATGEVSVALGNVIAPVPFNLDNTLTLNLLSRKMRSVFNEPLNFDIFLRNEIQTYKAHKFVLASRSSVFKNRLLGYIGTALTIPNIKSHFMRVFLEHLYTGLLSDLDLVTNCYMYEFGHMFDIRHLILRCTEEINPETVLDVLACADDENLSRIRSIALKLIAQIGEAITGHSGWNEFLYKKTNLALAVVDFLKMDSENQTIRC